MIEDDTQLFDPESGTLNPRANGDTAPLGPADDYCMITNFNRTVGCGQPWLHDGPCSLTRAINDPDDAPHEHARSTDPSTSQRAARGHGSNSSVRRGTQKHDLLAAYEHAGTPDGPNSLHGGLTADQACENTGHLKGWRRVYDLLTGGFLADTGVERLSRTGRAQRVLTITQQGREALAFLATSDRTTYRA